MNGREDFIRRNREILEKLDRLHHKLNAKIAILKQAIKTMIRSAEDEEETDEGD